jgi:hypothetical protein
VAEEEPDFASLIKVGTDVEALILGSEPGELVASCDAVLAEIDGALRTIADSTRACKDRVDDVERGLQVGSPRHICARARTAFAVSASALSLTPDPGHICSGTA